MRDTQYIMYTSCTTREWSWITGFRPIHGFLMSQLNESETGIAVIGGDGRRLDLPFPTAIVRSFPSPRYGGNGSLRRAVAAIAGGRVGLVVLLVRWLGHSDSRSVAGICKSNGVPLLTVRGGASEAHRRVAEFLQRGVRHDG